VNFVSLVVSIEIHLADLMQEELKTYLSELLGTTFKQPLQLAGGDIAEVYRIETQSQRFLLKIQNGPHALAMLKAEQHGLDAIRNTEVIMAPKVFHCNGWKQSGVLLMEYIEAKQPVARDSERLGHQLARMHQVTTEQFGWEQDNFIGSLSQKNTWIPDWSTFYLRNRLLPQIIAARDAGLLTDRDVPDDGKLVEVLDNLLHDIKPSLIHGDLWGGNYLISTDGIPFLIDPAISYSHFEMDLAMSRLFGGFGQSFYKTHEAIMPTTPGAIERNAIYQLYYLLVHLNLFGTSYRASVKQILERFFR